VAPERDSEGYDVVLAFTEVRRVAEASNLLEVHLDPFRRVSQRPARFESHRETSPDLVGRELGEHCLSRRRVVRR
jgi:hypothetical protein